MDLPIPLYVVYAGLGGTLIALIVATATNNWQPRVFFLLALRLAIGWHFLFEGLHKVNSHLIGPTEMNRTFSSEVYFRMAPGPLGPVMRKKFDDPAATIEAKVKPTREITAAEFARLDESEQAKACPPAVAEELKSVEAQAKYARWVHGVDRRATKVKFVNGEVALTAPERLEHIAWLRKQVEEAEARKAVGLGRGNSLESNRAAEARLALITAEIELASDANAFIKELAPSSSDEPRELSRGEQIDRITMWGLVVIGACLLAGFLTRPMAIAGFLFLLMTYLAYPPFPWYPLPPNTEGNPVFINKNVIEALALLVICCYPTGRWLGIDALFARLFCRPSSKRKVGAFIAPTPYVHSYHPTDTSGVSPTAPTGPSV